MMKEISNPLDDFFNKYDSKFEEELIATIKKYDAIDLLSKVSCASYFLRTTIFKGDSNTNNIHLYDIH